MRGHALAGSRPVVCCSEPLASASAVMGMSSSSRAEREGGGGVPGRENEVGIHIGGESDLSRVLRPWMTSIDMWMGLSDDQVEARQYGCQLTESGVGDRRHLLSFVSGTTVPVGLVTGVMFREKS